MHHHNSWLGLLYAMVLVAIVLTPAVISGYINRNRG